MVVCYKMDGVDMVDPWCVCICVFVCVYASSGSYREQIPARTT